MKNKENRITITADDGTQHLAQAPVIVSASRSTDIPAFYCDWFFNRLEKGYSVWTNPFNGKDLYVSYARTRFIVFWSKNPRPLLRHLDKLKELNINCYIQYTLNDYEEEGLEPNVPPLAERIDTFKWLVERLGFGSVVWRFDPLMLTDGMDINNLLGKIEKIGDELKGYTEKLVFSFVDIGVYKKVKNNLDRYGIHYRDWTEELMREFAAKLVALNKRDWNYELATCGEKGRYEGVEPNRCVDYNLMMKLAKNDRALMEYINAEVMPYERNLFSGMEAPTNAAALSDGRYVKRDKGQRLFCGCMKSKDIGQYNTCCHLCKYCYANANEETALRNYENHKRNPDKDKIVI